MTVLIFNSRYFSFNHFFGISYFLTMVKYIKFIILM